MNQAKTPIEDLRASALKHYEEASSAIHHWSSFVDRAIKVYDPAATPEGLRFIKCSDRLPDDRNDYNGRLSGRPAIVHDWKLAKGYVTANGHLEKVEDVEWLDETPTPVDEKFLLHLIDIVHGEIHEDVSVPSTKWAKEMIEKAKSTYPTPDSGNQPVITKMK